MAQLLYLSLSLDSFFLLSSPRIAAFSYYTSLRNCFFLSSHVCFIYICFIASPKHIQGLWRSSSTRALPSHPRSSAFASQSNSNTPRAATTTKFNARNREMCEPSRAVNKRKSNKTQLETTTTTSKWGWREKITLRVSSNIVFLKIHFVWH
jgi:hypothetical protein